MTADASFGGSIPRLYHERMGPLMFEPYAADMTGRIADLAPTALLETAAGTGIVTRQLVGRLRRNVRIVATDLSQAMIDFALSLGSWEAVTWLQADALDLPFADASFDVVACQFGVMFFADRLRGYREALRLLRPGGRMVFSVWDGVAANPVVAAIDAAVAAMFPHDPPTFLRRVPHGYCDPARITADLASAGFEQSPVIERVERTSLAPDARTVAEAYCQGTPLKAELEARCFVSLAEATDRVELALVDRFGIGPFDNRTAAWMITAGRSGA